MFERFTESARQIVVAGQDEARRLRHNYLGGEHLLLGLLSVEGVHRGVLSDFALTLNGTRERVKEIVGPGAEEVTTAQIPMTPRAKFALERSLREALSMGHGYIAPFHILLGLSVDPRDVEAQDGLGVARRILDEAGATEEFIRERLLSDLERFPRSDPLASFRAGRPVPFDTAPPAAKRCQEAITLYGAFFVCQRDEHEDGNHVEHGDGWTMNWKPE